jgi:hypothetical protein
MFTQAIKNPREEKLYGLASLAPTAGSFLEKQVQTVCISQIKADKNHRGNM